VRIAWASLLAGCALTGRAAPLEFRYFTPETSVPPVAHSPQPPCARLRLGRVTLDANLQFRIAHRDSPVELDLYETLRWTARPDTYVRRALSSALFEGQPLEQAIAGEVTTLDIEVIGFEEVVRDQRHGGRVQLGYRLHDDENVLARGLVTVERDARGPQIGLVVAAIGAAMGAASTEIASRVATRLCR
jgi:ABC-type uncharacterized transport system auxiliary subunit